MSERLEKGYCVVCDKAVMSEDSWLYLGERRKLWLCVDHRFLLREGRAVETNRGRWLLIGGGQVYALGFPEPVE